MRTRRWERGQWFPKRDGMLLVRILAVGLGAFVLGYLGMSLLFFGDPEGTAIATVPDLRRQTESTALEELQRANLEMEVRTSLVHPDVPKGAVLTQSPLPGQEVAPGSIVQVILSAGPDRRPVPAVHRLNRQQATRALESFGFQVVVNEVQDTLPAGKVVAVSPEEGTLLEVPAIVRLTVSTGPPFAPVPMLIGLRQEEARTVLEDQGFKLGEVEFEFRWRGDDGEIIAQDPPPGEDAPLGSAVNITIAEDRFIRSLPGG